jgi:hypothetical protein
MNDYFNGAKVRPALLSRNTTKRVYLKRSENERNEKNTGSLFICVINGLSGDKTGCRTKRMTRRVNKTD